jgi:dihydropteroate synthase
MTRPDLLGIVNCNPNSFSDPHDRGGIDDHVAFARRLLADGATMLDLGAQSATTDIPAEDPADEVAVLVPTIEALREETTLSIDTYKVEVAGPVLDAGAHVLNDYSGMDQPGVVELCAEHDAAYVLTHNEGRPKQRLTDPERYVDVVDAITRFVEPRLARCLDLGLAADEVWIDPGVDLSKTPAQTLAMLRATQELLDRFDQRLLLAISRKDVLGAALQRGPRQRDAGTLALALWLADEVDDPARLVLRVHDPGAIADGLRTWALLGGEEELETDAQLDRDLFRTARTE